jgi:ABC-type polysaccharide/polyol phosphate transport system ATPase subunit
MIDLKFDRVSKSYRIRRESRAEAGGQSFRRRLKDVWRRSERFFAVRDMSFEVERGEALGIIGPNGAGKSTILKLLSSITAPTSGEITIDGRLSALIEVGSGFHPELTGRENIYLSGSILGMRRREITERIDSIIDFAGVRQFIDTPVKRYSSGMYVRLGFSIAAHLEPDILLLDEVLAVGDAAFQSKCFRRIGELKDRGTTIIFISHDLNSVELLCNRVLLIDGGEIVAEGRARDVITRYQRAYGGDPSLRSKAENGQIDGQPKPAEITHIELYDGEGRATTVFHTGRPLRVQIEYVARRPISDAVFEVYFYSQKGRFQCQFTTALNGGQTDLEPGAGTVEFSCDELGLQPGIYYLDTTIRCRGGSEQIDWQYRRAAFRVDPGKSVSGRFYTPHTSRIKQNNLQSFTGGPLWTQPDCLINAEAKHE